MMEFQLLVVLAGFAATASATVAAVPAKLVDTEYDVNPQYSFAYDVHDSLTGDSKSQIESRNGGVVQGQYSLLEPDGTRRVVDYAADPINGFNAVVSKTPLVKAAPVVAAHAAPLAYAPAAYAPAAYAAQFAPIARVAYASPYAVY